MPEELGLSPIRKIIDSPPKQVLETLRPRTPRRTPDPQRRNHRDARSPVRDVPPGPLSVSPDMQAPQCKPCRTPCPEPGLPRAESRPIHTGAATTAQRPSSPKDYHLGRLWHVIFTFALLSLHPRAGPLNPCQPSGSGAQIKTDRRVLPTFRGLTKP